MRGRSGLLAMLVVAILFGWANSAYPQASAGLAQLNGNVRDESGGAVAKASVTLREMDTNRVYTAASNDDGFYVVPNLPPGRYELKVGYTGFANYTQTGLVLTVGQTATIDVTLKVASKGEQVVVTGEAPPIEPTKTEISQVIDTKQIGSLPINGRLFTDFALLTPGVAIGRTSLQSTFTEFEVTRVSFGGMRDFSNIVTVDGADTINTVTSSQRATPSQEAVSEFRVVNNSFGAEYGRALGGIVNIVTKSGGNDLHGSVYDYLRSQATDARSLLQPAPLAHTLRQNQFGATLGGPIRKDKTFFFMNYEGQRRAEAPTYPAMLLRDLPLINAAKRILLPNVPGSADENLNILKTADTDNGIVKVDHQLNGKHRLSVRYNTEDARDLNVLVGNTLDGGGLGAPSSGHNVFLRDHSLVGTLSSQFKPNFVNTFLAQYARRRYDFPGVTGQPNLDIPNSLLFGHNFGVFDFIGESRLQFSDSVAWVKSSHVVNFGVDTNFIRNEVLWPGFTPMRIVLPGINCLVDFANFVNPAPTLANQIASNPADGPCPVANVVPPFFGFPPPGTIGANPNDPLNGTPIIFWGAPLGTASSSSLDGTSPLPIPTTWQNAFRPDQRENFNVHLNHSYYGFFVQDQWKITPKLTLNYGLRWDFEAGLYRQVNPDYNTFAPRVGIAYAPDSHTVIRAGFGMFYDRYNLSFFFVTYPQRPPSPPVLDFGTGLPVVLPGPRQGAQTAVWALNQEPTLTIPGVAAFDASADARTLLLTGQLPPNYFSFPAAFAVGRLVTVATEGMDPNNRTSYSEQASLEINREIGKGLTVSAGYLFVAAHKLVRAQNLNIPCPVGTTTVTRNSNNVITGCSGAPAGKDVFPGVIAYDTGLIYFTDNSGNSVFHGLTLQASEKAGKYFRLNANYTFSKTLDDGTFTTFVSTPQDLYKRFLERANSNQDIRNRFIANFVASGPEKTILRNFELSSIITVQSSRPFTLFVGFDANNDTIPVTDRVGASARNTYSGDKLASVDLRLSRFFQLREKLRLQLIAETFNLFNRANVDEVTSVYVAANFCGGVTRQYKDAASLAIQQGQVACPAGGPPFPNPLFGTPRTMFNPRQLQFAAKLSF
jgi:outer membrane receptor protein involved in Fe transport